MEGFEDVEEFRIGYRIFSKDFGFSWYFVNSGDSGNSGNAMSSGGSQQLEDYARFKDFEDSEDFLRIL